MLTAEERVTRAMDALEAKHKFTTEQLQWLSLVREAFPQHRRIALWTFPVWAYVSVTGVLVYVMLYQLPHWLT